MSGGVDSSVVAGLLKREGHHLVGLTMQLWNQRRLPELASDGSGTGRCCSLDDVYDARAVADALQVPYYVVNFEERFERQVVKPFVDDYLAGRTPIPCTLCNNFIKFDEFLEMADGVGAEKIATGHYARLSWDEETGRLSNACGRRCRQRSDLLPVRPQAAAIGSYTLSAWRDGEVPGPRACPRFGLAGC